MSLTDAQAAMIGETAAHFMSNVYQGQLASLQDSLDKSNESIKIIVQTTLVGLEGIIRCAEFGAPYSMIIEELGNLREIIRGLDNQIKELDQ